jgi:hypothetical protein
MFEQGRYGRDTVASRITDTDGGDWWRRTIKPGWWNDGSLTGDSTAAAIAVAVDRASDGRASLSRRIGFLCWFLLLLLVGVAPDAEEEEEGLAVLCVGDGSLNADSGMAGRSRKLEEEACSRAWGGERTEDPWPGWLVGVVIGKTSRRRLQYYRALGWSRMQSWAGVVASMGLLFVGEANGRQARGR